MPKFAVTLPKLAVTCHKSIKLAEFGSIYLSSVSPRHFYCNWVSPVTLKPGITPKFSPLYSIS